MSPIDDLETKSPGFAPGKEVLKRYSLSRVLGRGGMGVVWLARDLELERDVALKFLPDAIASDKVAVDDLKREVRRAIDLAHTNIVKIYDFVTDGSVAGISMELVNGRTLSESRLEIPHRFFSTQALEPIVVQLCSALHYAHTEAHVVHRDLKPANIMISSEGRVKILDFGIAASISESASRVSNKGTSGTLSYMSPQQLLGRAPCPADDIYALGSTIYEMLTSKPPFFRGDVTHQALLGVPPTLAARRVELELPESDPIPDQWEKVIAACLSKEPTGRPVSVADVARQLGLASEIPLSLDPSFPSDQTICIRKTHAVAPAPAQTQESVPTPSPSRRQVAPSWLKWVLAILTMTAGLAAMFVGFEVPTRLRAYRLASNLGATPAETLGNLQEANRLRPQEPTYAQAYETAQQRWLADLRLRLDRLAPSDKLATLDHEVPAIEPHLALSYRDKLALWRQEIADGIRAEGKAKLTAAEEASKAGHYAEALALLDSLGEQANSFPEFSAVRTRVQTMAARTELDHALERLAQGDYPGALSELERTEKTGLLGDEIRSAKVRIYRAEEPIGVQKLYHAVARLSAPEELQAVIDEYARLAGRTLATTGQSLQSERNLDRFLGMLEELHLRSAESKPRQNAGELALIAARRNQFDQPDRVAGFLARNYLEWAEQQLQEKNRGFALYLESLSRAEGGPGDSGIQHAALSGQGSDFNLELAIARPDLRPNSAAVVGAAARESIQRALSEKIGSWFRIRTVDTVAPATPFAVHLQSQGPSTEQEKQSRTEVAEYYDGMVQEKNPEWAQKRDELDVALINAKKYETATQKTLQALVPKVVIYGKPLFTTPADLANQKVARLQNELNGIPTTIAKPHMAQEPYRITSIKTLYRARVTVQLEGRGATLDQPREWQSAITHLAEEVSGNSNHNVPVKAAEVPEFSAIARHLADDIADQARTAAYAWLPILCETSLDLVRQRLQDANTSPAQTADRVWELGQYWEKSGIAVPDRARLEQEVRRQLGLSSTAPTAVGGRLAGESRP